MVLVTNGGESRAHNSYPHRFGSGSSRLGHRVPVSSEEVLDRLYGAFENHPFVPTARGWIRSGLCSLASATGGCDVAEVEVDGIGVLRNRALMG